MNLYIRIFTALLILPSSILSQALALDKGQSGASLVYTYGDADDGTFQSGSFVNTAKGIWDIGVTVGSIDPDGFGDNVSLIGVQAEIYPIREGGSGGYPISLSLFGLWTNTGPNNTNGYGFGATAFKRIGLGKGLFVSPVVNYARLWPLGSSYGSENAFEFDFPFVLTVSPKLRICVTPAFVSSESQDVKGISFGLVFVGVQNPKK